MRKRKLKILNYKKIKRITDAFTHQGVLQRRLKLHCGTPFLMVRNLSDFIFYGVFMLTEL